MVWVGCSRLLSQSTTHKWKYVEALLLLAEWPLDHNEPRPGRHSNSPSRPSKAIPETGLKFLGLKILGLDGLGNFMTRLQDCRPYSPLIAPEKEIFTQFDEA